MALLPRLVNAGVEASPAAGQLKCALITRVCPATFAAVKTRVGAASLLRNYRITASAHQQELIETLGEEVSYEKQNYSPPAELASGPPNGFSLSESEGDTMVTLTKQHKGETVAVHIMVNDQPEEEFTEDESGNVDADVGAVFTASVTKGQDSLVFECKSDGEYFAVMHASLEPAEGELEDSAYTGPVYEELDEKLQAQFEQYLAERGVNQQLGAFLLPLIHDKEQREYVRWLGRVQEFVRS